MPQSERIRTIYLYLLSLIGIVMVVIGGSGFVSMALKAFFFTQADDERFLYREMPPKPYGVAQAQSLGGGEGEVVFRDSIQARRYQEALDEYLDRRERVDPATSQRHRDAASNLSFILIGLPVYLYHWRLIRRD
ncbi:MAG: hypothetical protein CME26_05990 [Gemmatimonadetes bacterium]|nr:hypothetical protein [Gemmatimonadota bacterium]|tara:strand:- start:3144 stop:3545 length:402 start_codon:yes stop_codon:yes gene_type:complete